MKINNRLLLTSGLLLALSTVAMSTATYAWFTVEKTASVTATATIKAEAGVEIGLLASGGHAAQAYAQSGTIELGAHQMTDISGNGVSFFKPVFASDNTTFSAVTSIGYEASSTVGYTDTFITAALKFRSNQPYQIFVGEEEDILSGTLAPAARLALFDGGIVTDASTTPTTANLKQVLYSGVEEDDYYISASTATSITTNTEGEANTGYTKANYGTRVARNDTVDKYANVAAANTGGLNCLATLAIDGGTYRVGDSTDTSKPEFQTYSAVVIMTCWIEGCDPQCTNSIINGSLSINLPFQFLLA